MNGFQYHWTPFDSSIYAARINMTQEYLDKVREKLPELGLPKYNPEEHRLPMLTPPRIIVLGNKDVGKSSLIYTLAQIPMTRKISTYCPVEIQLRRRTIEAQWKCIVSVIQFVHQKWTIVSSKETTEEHEVQDIVQSAQESVINPWGHFKTQSSVISITITGAALDITLMDLPPLDLVR